MRGRTSDGTDLIDGADDTHPRCRSWRYCVPVPKGTPANTPPGANFSGRRRIAAKATSPPMECARTCTGRPGNFSSQNASNSSERSSTDRRQSYAKEAVGRRPDSRSRRSRTCP